MGEELICSHHLAVLEASLGGRLLSASGRRFSFLVQGSYTPIRTGTQNRSIKALERTNVLFPSAN